MKLYSMALTTMEWGPSLTESVENRIVKAGFLLSLTQALLVRLQVDEVERVGGAEAAVDNLIAGLEEQVESLASADFEVVLALGADVEIGLQIGVEDGLAAAGTLGPEAFGADALFFVAVAFGAFEFAVLALEPGHRTSDIIEAGVRGQGSVNSGQGSVNRDQEDRHWELRTKGLRG